MSNEFLWYSVNYRVVWANSTIASFNPYDKFWMNEVQCLKRITFWIMIFPPFEKVILQKLCKHHLVKMQNTTSICPNRPPSLWNSHRELVYLFTHIISYIFQFNKISSKNTYFKIVSADKISNAHLSNSGNIICIVSSSLFCCCNLSTLTMY